MSNATKNLTVTLTATEHDQLDRLVEYFQKESISNVSKTDVVKYLIRRFNFILDNHNDEYIQSFEKRLKELMT
jgi:hypothetical protein